MLTEQTVDRLHHLRLAAMAEAYLAQQRDPAASSLSFDERLDMLVAAEHLARENRALRRRLTPPLSARIDALPKSTRDSDRG